MPRSVGYNGGVALAVAIEMIELSLGLFLATIPVVMLLDRRDLPKAVHLAVRVFDGMAKPVGGDAKWTIQLARTPWRLKAVAERAVGSESARPRPRRARRTRRSAPETPVQERPERTTGGEEA